MKYWVSFGFAFFLTLGVCRVALFRRGFPAGWPIAGLVSFALPLFLPYRLIEKGLLDYEGGTLWNFLVSALVNLVELVFLFIILVFMKKKDPEAFLQNRDILGLSFLCGFHFGWGKACRDSLLLFFHPLSLYYGYSQFLIFPSFSYLIPKMMEVVFEAQVGSFLGIGIFSSNTVSTRLLRFFFVLLFKGVPGFLQTAIQFVPELRFLSSLYLLSLFPLTLIVGFILLWYLRNRGG